MKTQAVVLFVSTLALSHGFILDILNKITGKSFQCTDSSGFKDPLIGKNITLILAFLHQQLLYKKKLNKKNQTFIQI